MDNKIDEINKVLEKDDNNGVKRLIDIVANILEEKSNQIEKQEQCIFCKSLLQAKSIDLTERSCYYVDNTYEFFENNNIQNEEQYSQFHIVSYYIKELSQRYLQLIFDNEYKLYNNEQENLKIKRFSYSIPWNYYPICGTIITPNGKPYEEDSYSTCIGEEQ